MLNLIPECIFKDMSCVKIPLSLEAVKLPDGQPSTRCLKYVTGFDNSLTYFNNLVENILKIKINLQKHKEQKKELILILK